MGGTFDPIHHGHLFIAEEARVTHQLDVVLFVPNRQPAHKEGKQTHASADCRWRMTTLALAGNPAFRPSRVELDRAGPSYLVDTLHDLGQDYPGAELFFIMGADSLEEILTWHRADEIFSLCTVLAAARPGFSLEEGTADLTPGQRAKVHLMPIPLLEISSRELRRRVRENRPIRYLTPDAVVNEIEQQGLYVQDTERSAS